MKNVYVKAALQTLAFIFYIAAISLGMTFIGQAVGTESAQIIFYSILGVVALAAIYGVLLARARYFDSIRDLTKEAK